jgi:hypothetical protein
MIGVLQPGRPATSFCGGFTGWFMGLKYQVLGTFTKGTEAGMSLY